VWSWGNNTAGQLGEGTVVNRARPVQVAGLAGITRIAAGYQDSLALSAGGTVWAWGGNGYGQLGDGTVVNEGTPTRMLLP
jgi:alpha-tubulin suppressor-like RCC1 family protein